MPLTDTAIRNAKPGPKPRRLFDAQGMYLEIHPAGGKYWRLKYRVLGKEKRISLGVYPTVGLKRARELRDEARKIVAAGGDPSLDRKAKRLGVGCAGTAESFEAIAREWFERFRGSWAPSHSSRILLRLENDVFPWLGSRPIDQIQAPELLGVLRRIESRGALESAHRVAQNCGQVFRYAIATGRATRDVSQDLRGALPPAKETHHAAITDPRAVGELLRAIEGYKGSFIVKCALRLAPLVFVRPGELRQAEWAEIDLSAAEWRIPKERMKARQSHLVPLSRQAVAVLQELQPLTSRGRYVFPSHRSALRPMSNNAVLGALRRLGYAKGEMTGHGFRSMASTILNEHGWNRDAIERQLAHAEGNEVRAAYNYAQHLPERRRMMQWWADHLDALSASAPGQTAAS